jgi:hypothetical protein
VYWLVKGYPESVLGRWQRAERRQERKKKKKKKKREKKYPFVSLVSDPLLSLS